MFKKLFSILSLFLFLTLAVSSVSFSVFIISCSSTDPVENGMEEKTGIMVSIPPQAEFVEKIGGEKVSVTVMVPPGADPH